MCFIKEHYIPKISFKPIKCCKIIKPLPGRYGLYTLFVHKKVNFGEPIKSKKSWFKSIFKSEFTEEVVHAYINDRRLVKLSSEIVVEAIIPPFTFYWTDKRHHEICSTKMIITDKKLVFDRALYKYLYEKH